MTEIGGSHAQRDLFGQILLDAHLKARQLGDRRQMLEMRRTWDPDGVPLNRALAKVTASSATRRRPPRPPRAITHRARAAPRRNALAGTWRARTDGLLALRQRPTRQAPPATHSVPRRRRIPFLRQLAQLAQRFFLDLPCALTRDAQVAADVGEGLLRGGVEAEAALQDRALTFVELPDPRGKALAVDAGKAFAGGRVAPWMWPIRARSPDSFAASSDPMRSLTMNNRATSRTLRPAAAAICSRLGGAPVFAASSRSVRSTWASSRKTCTGRRTVRP